MELVIAFLYYFRQCTKILSQNEVFLAGNLDPFYLGAPLYLMENYKNKQKLKRVFILILPIFLYAIFQLIFIRDINIIKMLINIIKISICILTMIYVKENYYRINIKKLTKIIAIFYAASIPLAMLLKSEIIWRLNDIYNKYSLQRLELFYLEPSELGFHIIIILIMLISFILRSEDNKEKILLITLIIANSIILYMARPLGAIVIGSFSIVVLLLLDLIINPSKNKIKVYSALVGLALVAVIFMIITKSPIYMRIVETLNGTDSSNSYRIGVTLDVFKQSFIDFKGIGCGFGNLNTEAFISKYNYLGLIVVVTNSFIYYIIECGIFGLITLGILIYFLVKRCIKDKSPMKWGLTTFLLLYQIFAGHFTSGLTWGIYGIVLSNFSEDNKN
ncbi:hypothetical protein [Clostridium saudiense]|uniref:hypothetical protein n=1 Tax=Clostridium saudiense TaxID=1414720 RepID=UPI00319E5BFF